jgi:hypothetical protein
MARSRSIKPLLLFLLLSTGPLGAQKKPEKPVVDPQAEAMDQLYAKLLETVMQNKADARRDDLRAIHEKRDAVEHALDAFARGVKRLVFDRRHLGLDYVRFAESTFPRLSGRVVKVGAGEQWTELQAARMDIEPGDVVLLGEGEFVLPRGGGGWRDIALVGQGSDKTTLTGTLTRADRVRLSALKIDCKNDPFLRLSSGGSVQIQKCSISNYNSGAGGSSAIYGVGVSILIEDCKFEGISGRSAGRGSGGTALDLRGANFLYVRRTDFIDNGDIVRATSFCVFDRCRSMSRVNSPGGISRYDSGFLMVRNNRCKIRGKAPAEFDVSTDDRAVVKYLMNAKAPLDDATRAAVDALGLRENLRYWATLLHHPDREVQFLASGRLASLLRRAMPVFKIEKDVLAQVPREMRKPFASALKSSRALRWIEDNDPKLMWSEKRRGYVLKK